jgi:DNA polymerase III epsilon subunit-like protein
MAGDNKLMRERDLLFIDIETTGLNPLIHEITEIGAVKISQPDFNYICGINERIMPSNLQFADQQALRINRFELSHWQGAGKDLNEVMEDLYRIGKDCVLVGYNITFDWSFIQRAFEQTRLPDPFFYHRVDVMSMAWAKFANTFEPRTDGKEFYMSRFSLSECCYRFGIENEQAHTAYSDAKATMEVYKFLVGLS